MDARSMPEDLDMRAFRYNRNFRLSTKRKICRTPGFEKLLTEASYNNADLHDQLLSKSGMASRKPITFLFEATSTRKTTKLIAGTDQVLFALNTGTKNWKILSDLYGTADTTYWRAGQLEDVVVFSNALDALVYWHFDQGITEASNQSVAEIPQLLELEITRAGTVVSWMSHIFLMNVTVSGSSRSNAIYWCNYKNPLDWQPGESSTAGNVDLDYGETILAALPLANRLLVYTNKGIWEGIAVGDEQVFQFTKRYAPENGENCLFYPRTLVSKGDEHVYAGEDGIYTYSLFMDKPKRPDWVHKASSVMFDSINVDACSAHVAGYNPELKEIYFSYATGENTIPNETLVINSEYPFAYVLDHGFSAIVSYTFRGSETLVRDFIRDRCICDDASAASFWGDFVKEGGFCTEEEAVSCPTPPTSIYTTVTRTETDGAESVEVEDWEEASAAVDSLCEQLDGLTLASICEEEVHADECNSGKRFVVASSTDYCLKEFSESFLREICTVFTDCGTYTQNGYKSILRSGPISAGAPEKDKQWLALILEASNVDQATPSQFSLRIGNHSQAVDPNADSCGIIWDTQDAKDIDCLSGATAEEHQAANTRPSATYRWPLYYEAVYLYWELTVENPDVSPVDTGGECCLSRLTLDMNLKDRRQY